MIAPKFSLKDQNNQNHSLKQYLGQWVVLYFYPKDDTPGCTKEACNFRDSFHTLQQLGVQILGISKDSVSSHQKFAKKYQLNFPLLSDEEKTVIKAYEAWGIKKFMGKSFEGTIRKTYLIDKKGYIVKVYPKVNPTIHASEVIKDIQSAEAKN
jgi:thioredoxin-dependent peroxiredoxin